ncbi:TPA: ATP-dependent helicase HrpB [Pseudomonas aeruginosa]|uniref:ATP-dependent helicase HrpB n=1 Tax=Pseudomonas TaxID=286 RepID=UPI00050E7EB9|nr:MULTISPECIES: ATP-dependent helicase HrpB [Pseudomonas]EIU7180195.1 ATP-dependent helicase HrpB [Pseudomonas aeruginosa]EKJ8516292.1 ATP-dependent helicase HrpB [Pseudomonas aeruginosa]EKV6259341.1 ATP-dependent helicase HrpB [Pseudomonas aeruginosa]EKX6243040.1 ATP-dependent helicase HrpB [Pseudomonas aeruginosa]EKZ9522678.1 ATP-dependent helicase HrpB [Pseudomonas aeruginosa]
MIQLPIDAAIPSLRQALTGHDSVVLQAPPGAGKTTRVPLALLNESWLADQGILMLQPRRVAARAAAERMASELGEKVGETVGYRIRLESRVGPSTRIEVVTEGILARRLQDDPSLEGVGLVIFDEFHLRSLDSDLALALCLNGRELFRDDQPLKLLVMSATLEGARLSSLLEDAPVVTSEGRMFPVDTVWGQPYQTGEYIEPKVVRACLDAVHDQQGSILVFLPGQAEIRRVHQELSDKLAGRDDLLLCALHGELDLSAQRAAIEPAPPGKRKIVLATNIAETSLTIEGVRVVIDSGLERVPRFDPSSGMTRLATQRISQASAAQRAGRAGRLEPGICYRLWSQTQHEQMAAYGAPEIHQADLAALALQLARWGVTPDQLRWLDMPPAAPFTQARDLLGRLGALEADGRLSSHGQAMAEVPAHPRIAHLLLRGHALGLGALACDVAALLGERDVLPGGGADLHSRLAMLEGSQRMPRHAQGAAQRIKQLARQYRSYQRGSVTEAVADPEHPRWLGCLLALAYPDRVAQQRRAGGGEYRLANGRAAIFTEPDALMKHSWLVVAELGSRQGQREERIYLATDLDPSLFENVLAEQVTVVDELDWDDRAGALVAERQRKVGELVLSREPLKELDADARSRALLGLVRKKGLELLPWTSELRQWQARVALLRELDMAQQGQSKWPCFRDDTLLATLEEWLLPYLNNVSRLSHFSLLDLGSILRGALPWPLPQELDELAPTHIKVPSGSSIKLDYSESPPVLAVRLQEMFGLADTPRIAGGKLPIKLHLLSPARRPVQVTQDLANFWRSTYLEVKKDLKGRYPKHWWPDDPMEAEPTARAKPRGS